MPVESLRFVFQRSTDPLAGESRQFLIMRLKDLARRDSIAVKTGFALSIVSVERADQPIVLNITLIFQLPGVGMDRERVLVVSIVDLHRTPLADHDLPGRTRVKTEGGTKRQRVPGPRLRVMFRCQSAALGD